MSAQTTEQFTFSDDSAAHRDHVPDGADYCDCCGSYYYVGEWPWCGGDPDKHRPIQKLDASRCEPMVYYTGPRGEQFVPGRSNDPRAHAEMVKRGYTRHEMRPGRQYDQWQARETKRIKAERERQLEAQEAVKEPVRAEARKQLRHDMQTMTPQGRAFAEHALERSEKKLQARLKLADPAPMVEACEYDSGSRTAWRDKDTGYKARK